MGKNLAGDGEWTEVVGTLLVRERSSRSDARNFLVTSLPQARINSGWTMTRYSAQNAFITTKGEQYRVVPILLFVSQTKP